jgi:hypothetical protein
MLRLLHTKVNAMTRLTALVLFLGSLAHADGVIVHIGCGDGEQTAELAQEKDLGRHPLCLSGLPDDTWFCRTFWRLGCGDVYDCRYFVRNVRAWPVAGMRTV